jgi:hypothetical protein
MSMKTETRDRAGEPAAQAGKRGRFRNGRAKSSRKKPKVYVLPSGKAIRIRRGSALELAHDLIGCLKGLPKDLSTNPKYLEGLGRDSLGHR